MPLTVSIVSHGHARHVASLLAQLQDDAASPVEHVVLTHNLPQDPVQAPAGGWRFEFTELFNDQPRGFGANHNRAFAHCTSPWFAVVNPDIEVRDAQMWWRLLEKARDAAVGGIYPVLLNEDGSRQENERELVTPWALLRRHLWAAPQRRTDWVSAAFLLVRAEAWRSVGGFDERYFMYCEDVDLCLRLQLKGWRLVRADAFAAHPAAWGSRKDMMHLAWHARSLLRLWCARCFRTYLVARDN